MSADSLGLQPQPFPIIFAAPSGAGKTSIAQGLADRRDDVMFSISATTRPARPGEQDGVDYHFRSEPEFRRMAATGELLEWAEVHGNLYGTPRQNLSTALDSGAHLILDVDVQGSRQIRMSVPEAVSVFVLPPSGDELARRLMGRGSEPAADRRRRLQAARAEIGSVAEFDYVIVNDDLTSAVDRVEHIIAAESIRTRRIAVLSDAVARLCAGVDESLGSTDVDPQSGP